MNLSELMIRIRENPSQFLQDDCIFQLRAFLRGFIFAKNTSANLTTKDHQLLDSIDSKIKSLYGIKEGEIISIEEILDDNEKENAFSKYLEQWFRYAQH